MTERTAVETVVVMPVGPADNALDTVESVLTYVASPRVVIIVDDTRGGGTDMHVLQSLSPDVEVIPAPPSAKGNRGGLWVKCAAGYRHAVDYYDFTCLLRLDADALMIGSGLDRAAVTRFADDPNIGLLGSYRVGPDGGARSFDRAARQLRLETGLLGWRNPRVRRVLRAFVTGANRHGYVSGEHVLGAACLCRPETMREISTRGWLDQPSIAPSRVADDHLLSMLVVAAGFSIGDFGGPDDPIAVRWRGLPCAPSDLLARQKLVTHSVRSWQEMSEAEIRSLFASHRHGAAT